MEDSGMDEKAMAEAKKLLALLKEPQLVGEYIIRYGLTITARNIADLKARRSGVRLAAAAAGAAAGATGPNPTLAARAAAIAAQNKANAEAMAAKAAASRPKGAPPPAAEANKDDEDPVFETTVNCPICGHTGLTSYEMRAKSQQVLQTVLLVPVFNGATGFKTVDYSLLAVAVCPKCLFASPDRKNFNYPSFTGNKEEKSTLNASVLLALKDKIEDQKKLLPEALDNLDYFKRERSPKVAIESYRLAMARAEVEAELSQPYAYFKMGSYLLKIARIMKNSGQDDTEVMKEALVIFEKSYAKSECETDEIEMQVLYLITTLYIMLDDFTKANSYLTAFSRLIAERTEAMKKNPALNTQWIQKWQDRAKYNWEERDNKEYFHKL
ncbi:MAG: DUF2225 domain-containing protein [Chitinispirillia bacterium]|nr:DUF2225 domain-containing protein [Chitinispirillia bacterium]MCL2269000.1 DUF2225 domain-containing protein [Chitinispirillia bacterium]